MHVAEPDIPGFYTADQMDFLASLVLDAAPRTTVEVGSYMGRSTYAICTALRELGGQRSLVCVDSWPQVFDDTYFDQPAMQRLFRLFPDVDPRYRSADGHDSVMGLFEVTLDRFPFMRDYVSVRNVDSRHVDLSDLSIDFAFLDAAHTFNGVRNDLSKVLEGAAPGVTVAFHDYADRFPGVQRVVDAALATRLARRGRQVGTTISIQVHSPRELLEVMRGLWS